MVVAQLVDPSPSTSENRGLNPVIGNFIYYHLYKTSIEMAKIKRKRGRNGPFKKTTTREVIEFCKRCKKQSQINLHIVPMGNRTNSFPFFMYMWVSVLPRYMYMWVSVLPRYMYMWVCVLPRYMYMWVSVLPRYMYMWVCVLPRYMYMWVSVLPRYMYMWDVCCLGTCTCEMCAA